MPQHVLPQLVFVQPEGSVTRQDLQKERSGLRTDATGAGEIRLQVDSGVQTSGMGIVEPMASGKKKPKITECAYLTDVKGNLDYFYNYVEISNVLEWENKETKNRLKFMHEHTMLVFGGDSQDKGIGDIRFTKLLLDLKAQPGNEDRVEFIIGNRDANKLRLASELQDDCIRDPDVLNGMRE
jgi:hypothetical protein